MIASCVMIILFKLEDTNQHIQSFVSPLRKIEIWSDSHVELGEVFKGPQMHFSQELFKEDGRKPTNPWSHIVEGCKLMLIFYLSFKQDILHIKTRLFFWAPRKLFTNISSICDLFSKSVKPFTYFATNKSLFLDAQQK